MYGEDTDLNRRIFRNIEQCIIQVPQLLMLLRKDLIKKFVCFGYMLRLPFII